VAEHTGSPALRLRRAAWLLATALLLASPWPARAQASVAVLPVQGLRFGILSSGLPVVVSPLDGSRRASIELVGSGQVTVTFELPTVLRAGRGSPGVPLRFEVGDGRVSFPGSSRVLVFDPSLPVSFSIPPGSGGATVHLGGTAYPGPRQAPGDYGAEITVQVVVANSAT
jgi:hypothetical protein